MWKSLLMTSHMFAHHTPSLNHRMLSARLVPVGVPRPVSVEPAASTPAGGDDGTVLASVTGLPPSAQPLRTAASATAATATASKERWTRLILTPGRQTQERMACLPIPLTAQPDRDSGYGSPGRDGEAYGTGPALLMPGSTGCARRRTSGRRSPDARDIPQYRSDACAVTTPSGVQRVHPDVGEQPVVAAVRATAADVVGPGAGVEVARRCACDDVLFGAVGVAEDHERHGRAVRGPAPRGRARPPAPDVAPAAFDAQAARERPGGSRRPRRAACGTARCGPARVPRRTGSPARDASASTSARYGAAAAAPLRAAGIVTAARVTASQPAGPARRRPRRTRPSGASPRAADDDGLRQQRRHPVDVVVLVPVLGVEHAAARAATTGAPAPHRAPAQARPPRPGTAAARAPPARPGGPARCRGCRTPPRGPPRRCRARREGGEHVGVPARDGAPARPPRRRQPGRSKLSPSSTRLRSASGPVSAITARNSTSASAVPRWSGPGPRCRSLTNHQMCAELT